MLCWCPYSNTNYRTDNFKGKWKGTINAPHPIFYSPVDSLLQRAGDLVSGELVPQEARLVFLALLNSTGLVTWEYAADPQAATVLLNSEALVRFINWKHNAASAALLLPRFVVRHANRRLENCEHWLSSLFEAKKSWELRNSDHRLREKLAQKEAVLHRLLHSTTKRGNNYALKLAAWAMEAAAVPDNMRSYWTQLFSLTGLELYKPDFTLADFSELREHMEDNLQIYNSPLYVNAVLHHVRRLEEIRAKGLDYWLGITATGASSAEEAEQNNYRFLDDSIESNNVSAAIETYAPLTKPSEREYDNKVAFIRAKAAWMLAEQKREQAAALMQRQLEAEREETLQSLDAAEQRAEDADNFDLLTADIRYIPANEEEQ